MALIPNSILIRTALYGLALNAAWEFLQCTFFYDMGVQGFWRSTLWMWSAIFGDVLIVAGVVWLAHFITGPRHLFPPDGKGWLALLAVGFAAGVIMEWMARLLNLWSYSARMPVIKIFGDTVGLSPILQITLLPAMSIYLAARRIRSRM